ncbi:hypothetical protein Pedsa_0954 [Pseudopedobacter saltans DSM 12145]|uniref:Phage virion morphogenesis protein n=1 Tax=Pseudopedobacter saltans (strain ATCC 51119 / DSM 12145 / JCM 21818 / CCUG 39354 / LMG 10337 / NBRC 100064 / NCIMB 13643) TaxID=762903 RepID=F0SAE9_PSESL|nr:phage virion morphogenesis protein [Pseudopedobacter saltans]ADY51526.1 hypothetical protein Pedsa_0954 [Pseudopedobacter saltans DSM 12145]
MSNQFQIQLENFFARFNQHFDEAVPTIIAETANEYYRESFVKKSFDGKPWPALSKNYKPKRGTMMVRSANLINSIRPGVVSPSLVTSRAGSTKVPYARVHNEGEQISRTARSETFMRNRYKAGNKKGKFKRGATYNTKGYTFKAYSYNMPQRQFMGHAKELNQRIVKRIISYTIL